MSFHFIVPCDMLLGHKASRILVRVVDGQFSKEFLDFRCV